MGSNNNQRGAGVNQSMTRNLMNANGQSFTNKPLSGSVQKTGPNPYRMDPRNGPIPGLGTTPNPGIGPSYNAMLQSMNQGVSPMPSNIQNTPTPTQAPTEQAPIQSGTPQVAMNDQAPNDMSAMAALYGPNSNSAYGSSPQMSNFATSLQSINGMMGGMRPQVMPNQSSAPMNQGMMAANPMANYMNNFRRRPMMNRPINQSIGQQNTGIGPSFSDNNSDKSV